MKSVNVKRLTIIIFLIVVGVFLLWSFKWSMDYYKYTLKKENYYGIVVKKERPTNRHGASFIYLNDNTKHYVYRNIYDSVRIGDYISKVKRQYRYLLIRGTDSLYVLPIDEVYDFNE